MSWVDSEDHVSSLNFGSGSPLRKLAGNLIMGVHQLCTVKVANGQLPRLRRSGLGADAPAMVYSIGVILFEMLTAKLHSALTLFSAYTRGR